MKPLMIVLTLLTFQSYPPPFPREGVTKLFENERVVVWTAAFLKNRPTPLHEHTMDGIGVFLSEGQLRNRMLDGTVREGKPFGNGHVVLAQRGVIHIEESLVEGTKAILIELKEAGPQTANLVATGSHATQLPSDQRLLLENARVRIVEETLRPRMKPAAHSHLDRVEVYMTPCEGKTGVNAMGATRWVVAGMHNVDVPRSDNAECKIVSVELK